MVLAKPTADQGIRRDDAPRPSQHASLAEESRDRVDDLLDPFGRWRTEGTRGSTRASKPGAKTRHRLVGAGERRDLIFARRGSRWLFKAK
jgi:hypothetical protein